MQNIVFVIGGVISSVGKGVLTSSLGMLLKKQKLKILLKKIDPYFNVDAGTMNPIQHGEVFCTADGFETDLDIGHYERFMGEKFNRISSITSGQIFYNVINDERKGRYIGATVQAIPHITDSIIKNILNTGGKKYDFIIVEIGGTIGDIEISIFLEACRQIKAKAKCCFILVTHVPYLKTSHEYKSKPTQRSFFELSASGIIPDFIILRSEDKIPEKFHQKISYKVNITKENLINLPNLTNKFEVPLYLRSLDFDKKVTNFFNLDNKLVNLDYLTNLNQKIKESHTKIFIKIVGKYTKLPDAYISITEAIELSIFLRKFKPVIEFISSQNINKSNVKSILGEADAVIIPGGFGTDGIAGKLIAIRYCRENNVCTLGICLGFQLMVLEYIQNVLNIKNVSNAEIDPDSEEHLFIAADENVITNKEGKVGGSMILGEQQCLIKENTKASHIYNSDTCTERFRHRYVFNGRFLNLINTDSKASFDIFTKNNEPVFFSIKNHVFYCGCQFHPEFNFKLIKEHLLFKNFIKSTLNNKLNL